MNRQTFSDPYVRFFRASKQKEKNLISGKKLFVLAIVEVILSISNAWNKNIVDFWMIRLKFKFDIKMKRNVS